MATELFYKELKEDTARTELANCDKCKSNYDRTTSIKIHYCLKNIYDALSEMREILRK
jgi:hypothetical protein